jgi:hypothetical protein
VSAAAARPWANCTGAGDCPEAWHVHGCYADTGKCDDPLDHHRYAAMPDVGTVAALDEARAQAWDEAVRAVAWAQENGPDPLRYVAEHNPYRDHYTGQEADRD